MSDLGTFSIRVVNEEGYGVSGAEVSCDYEWLTVGTEYTDEDGWATFSIEPTFFSGSAVAIQMIWVNGEEVHGWFRPEDGDTLSFTVP